MATEHPHRKDGIAWVCLIDGWGRKIINEKVQTQYRVTNHETEITGGTADNLRGARTFVQVQHDVAAMLQKARIVIMHTQSNDIKALELTKGVLKKVQDVATKPRYKDNDGKNRKLKELTEEFLKGVSSDILDVQNFQSKAHDPYDDALASLLLYYNLLIRSDK